eukprot:755476-Hanusia_phi.AAC.1
MCFFSSCSSNAIYSQRLFLGLQLVGANIPSVQTRILVPSEDENLARTGPRGPGGGRGPGGAGGGGREGGVGTGGAGGTREGASLPYPRVEGTLGYPQERLQLVRREEPVVAAGRKGGEERRRRRRRVVRSRQWLSLTRALLREEKERGWEEEKVLVEKAMEVEGQEAGLHVGGKRVPLLPGAGGREGGRGGGAVDGREIYKAAREEDPMEKFIADQKKLLEDDDGLDDE